jgi:hypothetical protein
MAKRAGRQLPFIVRNLDFDDLGLFPPGALPLDFGEQLLAQPNMLRRHFHQLIFFDVLQRLLQRHCLIKLPSLEASALAHAETHRCYV